MPQGPFGGPRPFAEQDSTAILRVETLRDSGKDTVSEVLRTIDDEISRELADELVDRMETTFGKYLSDAERLSNDGVDILLPIEGMSPSQVRGIQSVLEQNITAVKGGSIESVEVI